MDEKQRLNNELEDLREQLEAQTEEVTNEKLESHKSLFTSFIDGSKEKLDSLLSGETATKMRQSLEELQVQLALGKAESREALEEQKQKMDAALQEAERRYEALKDDADDDFHEWTKEFSDWKDKLQTRMDIARLHFALGTAEAKEELEEKRQDLSQRIASIKTQLDELEDKGEEKWEAFTKEVGESYNQFKSAVKGLFS